MDYDDEFEDDYEDDVKEEGDFEDEFEDDYEEYHDNSVNPHESGQIDDIYGGLSLAESLPKADDEDLQFESVGLQAVIMNGSESDSEEDTQFATVDLPSVVNNYSSSSDEEEENNSPIATAVTRNSESNRLHESEDQDASKEGWASVSDLQVFQEPDYSSEEEEENPQKQSVTDSYQSDELGSSFDMKKTMTLPQPVVTSDTKKSDVIDFSKLASALVQPPTQQPSINTRTDSSKGFKRYQPDMAEQTLKTQDHVFNNPQQQQPKLRNETPTVNEPDRNTSTKNTVQNKQTAPVVTTKGYPNQDTRKPIQEMMYKTREPVATEHDYITPQPIVQPVPNQYQNQYPYQLQQPAQQYQQPMVAEREHHVFQPPPPIQPNPPVLNNYIGLGQEFGASQEFGRTQEFFPPPPIQPQPNLFQQPPFQPQQRSFASHNFYQPPPTRHVRPVDNLEYQKRFAQTVPDTNHRVFRNSFTPSQVTSRGPAFLRDEAMLNLIIKLFESNEVLKGGTYHRKRDQINTATNGRYDLTQSARTTQRQVTSRYPEYDNDPYLNYGGYSADDDMFHSLPSRRKEYQKDLHPDGEILSSMLFQSILKLFHSLEAKERQTILFPLLLDLLEALSQASLNMTTENSAIQSVTYIGPDLHNSRYYYIHQQLITCFPFRIQRGTNNFKMDYWVTAEHMQVMVVVCAKILRISSSSLGPSIVIPKPLYICSSNNSQNSTGRNDNISRKMAHVQNYPAAFPSDSIIDEEIIESILDQVDIKLHQNSINNVGDEEMRTALKETLAEMLGDKIILGNVIKRVVNKTSSDRSAGVRRRR